MEDVLLVSVIVNRTSDYVAVAGAESEDAYSQAVAYA